MEYVHRWQQRSSLWGVGDLGAMYGGQHALEWLVCRRGSSGFMEDNNWSVSNGCERIHVYPWVVHTSVLRCYVYSYQFRFDYALR